MTYKKLIPYKDFNGKPRNETVHFNLTEVEVFKLFAEFKQVMDWRESIQAEELQELDPAEVVNFYNSFEEILLTAWGIPSDDGKHFRKAGRYEFQESALFNAAMVMFVTDPQEANKLLSDIMPPDMEEMIKKADANLASVGENPKTTEAMQREIAELRAKVADTTNNSSVAPPQQ